MGERLSISRSWSCVSRVRIISRSLVMLPSVPESSASRALLFIEVRKESVTFILVKHNVGSQQTPKIPI